MKESSIYSHCLYHCLSRSEVDAGTLSSNDVPEQDDPTVLRKIDAKAALLMSLASSSISKQLPSPEDGYILYSERFHFCFNSC
jgi:hypothetical protein